MEVIGRICASRRVGGELIAPPGGWLISALGYGDSAFFHLSSAMVCVPVLPFTGVIRVQAAGLVGEIAAG